MQCPICHDHKLRNKTEKDVRYRHCKGCGWKKAIKEQVTVEREMAEIDKLIHAKPVEDIVGIPVEVAKEAEQEPIDSGSDVTQKSVVSNPEPAKAEIQMQEPAKPMIEQVIPKTVEEAKYCPRCRAYHTSQEPCIPERAGSAGTRQVEPKADTDKPTIEQVIAKATGEPEKKPKKGFLKRLFGK